MVQLKNAMYISQSLSFLKICFWVRWRDREDWENASSGKVGRGQFDTDRLFQVSWSIFSFVNTLHILLPQQPSNYIE